jgi:hypothetical protein
MLRILSVPRHNPRRSQVLVRAPPAVPKELREVFERSEGEVSSDVFLSQCFELSVFDRNCFLALSAQFLRLRMH